MKKHSYRVAYLACLLLVSTGMSNAQIPTEKPEEGEFPGLQLLPPGSIIEGINLPRYEEGRVTSLIKAHALKVITRSLVRIEKLSAALYDKKGYVSNISSASANYDFAAQRIHSAGLTEIKDSRIRAVGGGVIINVPKRTGVLRGPVRTILAAPTQPKP